MTAASVRIFVASEPVDMRLGFDRLAQLVRNRLGEDPQSGALFLFRNRGATRIKALWLEHHGYCLLYKRLNRAVFELPAPGGAVWVHIDAPALARLLVGVERRRGKSGENREK